MAYYGDTLPAFIKDETEEKVLKRLHEIQLGLTGTMLNIITIYPRGSNVYAWYYIDAKRHGIPAPSRDTNNNSVKKISKKQVKKLES